MTTPDTLQELTGKNTNLEKIILFNLCLPSDFLAKNEFASLTLFFTSGSQPLGSKRPATAHVPYGFDPSHPGQSLRRVSSGTSCSFETGGDSHGMKHLAS